MIILSSPLTLEASSATDFTRLPATIPVIDPPSFWAAVTALSEAFCSFPSLCSRIARELR